MNQNHTNKMQRYRRIALLLLAFVMALVPLGDVEAAQLFTYEDKLPSLLIGDYDTGKILYEKNIDEKRPIASMSKLMTYYVVKQAIDNGEIQMSDMVHTSAEAAALAIPGYSNFGLTPGTTVSVESLLEGLMVISGNDAAVSLAMHTSGSIAAFAQRMNETAQKLGLTQSEFFNPNGLNETIDGVKHQNSMSARDLFTLSSLIIRTYPEVLDYASIRQLEVPERGYSGESTIPLTTEIQGLDGLKTGYTEEAGYCFTGTVDMSQYKTGANYRIITIVMGCATKEERTTTTAEMIEYTAGTFTARQVIDEHQMITRYKMNSGIDGGVDLFPSGSYSTILRNNAVLEIKMDVTNGIKAPQEAGTDFGDLYLYQNGELVEKFDLVNELPVIETGFMTRLQRTFRDFIDALSLMVL